MKKIVVFSLAAAMTVLGMAGSCSAESKETAGSGETISLVRLSIKFRISQCVKPPFL